MKKFAPWAGWAFAAAVCVGLGAALWSYAQSARELRARLDAQQARIAELEKALQERDAAADDLKRQLADLKKASAAWSGGSDSGALAGRLLKSILAQNMSGADSTKTGDWVGHFVAGLAGFVSSNEGKEIIGLSVDIVAEDLFDQFFNKAGLSPEAEDAAREIVARNMRDDVSAVLDVFRGGFDLKKAFDLYQHFKKSPTDERIRSELAGVLDADQMAQWDQRNAAMETEDPKRIMEGALMMSLPDLAPENRATVAEVFTDELRASHDANESMSFSDFLDFQKYVENSMAGQQAMYDRVRERLSQQLDPAQMAVAETFLHRQERTTEVGMRVVNLLFGGASSPAQQ